MPENGNKPISEPFSPLDENNFPIDLKQSMAETEVKLINKALEISQFNQKKCAEMLGLTYHQLRGYLKKYQLLEHKD